MIKIMSSYSNIFETYNNLKSETKLHFEAILISDKIFNLFTRYAFLSIALCMVSLGDQEYRVLVVYSRTDKPI